jgi:hypothetical protein
MTTKGPTAAIAGIMPGVQSEGVWTGRRQLFVRFASEAETATLYTPDMLNRYLERGIGRGGLHSVSLTGRDPLSCGEFLVDAFSAWKPTRPVMLDCDGQHHKMMDELCGVLAMVQVSVDLAWSSAAFDRALATLVAAGRCGCGSAAVLAPRDGTSDGQLLRFVEQTHKASPGTKIVIHPPHGMERIQDRRYLELLEHAAAIHDDVRLVMRIGGRGVTA